MRQYMAEQKTNPHINHELNHLSSSWMTIQQSASSQRMCIFNWAHWWHINSGAGGIYRWVNLFTNKPSIFDDWVRGAISRLIISGSLNPNRNNTFANHQQVNERIVRRGSHPIHWEVMCDILRALEWPVYYYYYYEASGEMGNTSGLLHSFCSRYGLYIIFLHGWKIFPHCDMRGVMQTSSYECTLNEVYNILPGHWHKTVWAPPASNAPDTTLSDWKTCYF